MNSSQHPRFPLVDTALLDWGIGGLSVYNEIKKIQPDRSILYFSDSGQIPYGSMSREILFDRVRILACSFYSAGIKRLVLACNAASTVLPQLQCVPDLRDMELTGIIEHGIALATKVKKQNIGVIGGTRTIRSKVYTLALTKAGFRARGRIAQPLSGFIERGELDSPELLNCVKHVLAPLRDVDALLLACTHYPAIIHPLQEQLPGALLLDPAREIARYIALHWRPYKTAQVDAFFSTGSPILMRESARRAFGNTLISISRVKICIRPP